MSGNATLEKIRRLAQRRQALWSKMSSLTAVDRVTIVQITRELEVLWEQYRAELAQRRGSGRRGAKAGGVSPRRSTAA